MADADPASTASAERTMGLFPKFTRTISYLGLPAISVPGGFASNGLPIGFQLVGRPLAAAQRDGRLRLGLGGGVGERELERRDDVGVVGRGRGRRDDGEEEADDGCHGR